MQKRSHDKSDRRTRRAADVAILGIAFALMIILQLFASLLQKLGMPMSLALGLIPVLVLSQTHGIKHGVILGGMFGLFTLVFSAIYASAIPIYSVTINPLVSVFPRIMVGVVSSLIFGGFMRLASRKHPSPTPTKRRLRLFGISAASTILGVLTNTVLYIGLFFAFAHGKTFDNLVIDMKWLLTSIVALNTVIELALFTVVVPPIVYAMTESRLAGKLRVQSFLAKEENATAKKEEGSTDEQNFSFDNDPSLQEQPISGQGRLDKDTQGQDDAID